MSRQNFHEDIEAALNKQVHLELRASLEYQALAAYFSRDNVGLTNSAKFFRESAREEYEHAEKFIEVINKRGGRVKLNAITGPSKHEFETLLEAFQHALGLEKEVNQAIIDIHKLCDEHNDYQLADYLEGTFLNHQVDSIFELSHHVARLERSGAGVGEVLFDLHALS